MEALQKERNLLVSKVENLEEVKSSIMDELEGKGKCISDLKKKFDDLESTVGRMKTLETLKNDLEKTIEKTMVEIGDLESRVDEKEEVITEFIMKERAALDDVYGVINGNAAIGVGRKGMIRNSKQKDWVVTGDGRLNLCCCSCDGGLLLHATCCQKTMIRTYN